MNIWRIAELTDNCVDALVVKVTQVFQIYVSLDDYIVKRWSNSKLVKIKLKDVDPDKLQDSPFQKKSKRIVSKAQRISEETAMMAREMANEFEKVSAFNVIVCMKSAIVFLNVRLQCI